MIPFDPFSQAPTVLFWLFVMATLVLFVIAVTRDYTHFFFRRAERIERLKRGLPPESKKTTGFTCLRGNAKEGFSVVRFANGNVYRGYYHKGRKHGQGLFIWRDGRRYEGEWRNGRMNGVGVMSFPLGSRYVGQFVNDKKQGSGVYHWANGGVYEGEFHNNLRHGLGVYVSPEGKRFAGIWRDDAWVGRQSERLVK
ncbi:MORN repeat-containing protein [Magnetofaba australis]|uniref:MORN repeat-containing protein n=1 Tax=Magnetofaba australis IT-1 TaxID=1434232 RepID=A0A1Y2K741_9PROT|nr:hypothetical protein [Magnetofaba australis]OSM06147.1 hypothetical protein MAIT1_01110 [Magnetofaba australis IT-1]